MLIFHTRLSIKQCCQKKSQRLFGIWRSFFFLVSQTSTLTNLFLSSQWREKQKEVIAERDAISEQKKQETINRAREDIDKFYEEYNDKKQKAIEENR